MKKVSVKHYDERGAERFDVEGDVTLKVYMTRADDVREVRATLVNAGVGGLYIHMQDTDLPLGALADLEIRLEGGPLQTTLGLVRWLEPGKGAGIEFFYSTDEERDALDHYLRQWQRARCNSRVHKENGSSGLLL